MKPSDLLYPQTCVLCGTPAQQQGICPKCRQQLRAQYSVKMLLELEAVFCAAWYYGGMRQALLNCKFLGSTVCFAPFSAVLAEVWRETGLQADMLTWVPCSPLRARKRGFDQSEQLARRVGELCGIPVHKTLRRRLLSRRQSDLNAEQRQRNARAGFYLANRIDLTGRHVVLVDDILTTGATLCACAHLLHEAGAGQVTGLALSRTVAESHEKHGSKFE